jgi:hypothetical protein
MLMMNESVSDKTHLSLNTSSLNLTTLEELFDYKSVYSIGLDFDGTCVEHKYPIVGQNAPHVVEALQYFNFTGRKLYLFTVRGSNHISPAINWFSNNSVRLTGIQEIPEQKTWNDSPKPAVDMFIDDRSFGAPLIKPVGFMTPVIDWLVILDKFRKADSFRSGTFINSVNKSH